MDHVGEAFFRYLYGEGFNLTCPYRFDSAVYRRQRKATDAVEETAHGDFLTQTKIRMVASNLSAK